jgi:methionine aminotransferase
MIASKLPHIGTTIFTTMSAMANEHNAINLSQGFPNFPLDENLSNCFTDAVAQNVHQYAPMAGLISLRETLSKIIFETYQRTVSPDEILITAGATQGIFTIVQALIHNGDEAIVIDPSYDCYRPALDLVGAKVQSVPLKNNFELDIEQIEAKMNAKTRLLILNNPHNPSGTVFSKNQLDALVELLDKYPNCFVLSDEVYEFINFSNEPTSLNFYSSLFNRLIVCSSFGKSLHITGWKVAYITCAPSIMNEIKKVHQFLVFSVNHFAQFAINNYIQKFSFKNLAPFYQAKRDLLLTFIKMSKFKPIPCQGTYFQTIDIQSVTDMKDVDYAVWLVQNAGLATIPLSVFYANAPKVNYLRLCFAKDDDTLTKAGKILCQI